MYCWKEKVRVSYLTLLAVCDGIPVDYNTISCSLIFLPLSPIILSLKNHLPTKDDVVSSGWSRISMCLQSTLLMEVSTDARLKTRWEIFFSVGQSWTQRLVSGVCTNLSHQVGMVAHSSRLNIYGPPSSRGLHNVTAVSRFIFISTPILMWLNTCVSLFCKTCLSSNVYLFNKSIQFFVNFVFCSFLL